MAVHDCGRAVNPTVVEGQVTGGISQGLSAALAEKVESDDAGQLLTATFLDYAPHRLQRAPFVIRHFTYPSTANPLGACGVGEAATICPPAVVGNAVEDALGPFGVVIDEAPVTRDRIATLLRAARRP